MRHTTKTIAAAALLSISVPAMADVPSGARFQLMAGINNHVRSYVPGADLSGLSLPALQNLRNIVFSDRTESEKRRLVRSALNDRTLFFPRRGGIALSNY